VTTFVCADDPAAKGLVLELADSLGFFALDSGPLSKYTEAMAHLNIHLAVVRGGGTDAAFVYHRP
jgi:predicted dinucleotide-binding enzyme